MNLKKHRSIYNEVHTLKQGGLQHQSLDKKEVKSRVGRRGKQSRVSKSDKGKFCSRLMKVL